MSKTVNPAERGKPDLRPEAQTDESHGSVKSGQLSDGAMPEPDIARGAPGGTGRGGAGPANPTSGAGR